MGYAVEVHNAQLDLLDEDGTYPAKYLSLHTDDPGDTGAHEVTGGSYERQAITWQPAADGAKTINETPVFQIPSSTTIKFFGLWSVSSGGSWRGGDALPTNETYTGPGTYTAKSLTIT